MNRRMFWLFALALGLLAPSFASAQEREGRGNFDPARFREEAMKRMQEQLGASAEEWTVIQPKVDKLMTAQRDNMGGRGFGGRGGDRDRGGDRGSSASNQPSSPLQTASRELRETLDNKEAAPEQITAKLTALREARAKAREQLVTAQKDLQSVLTPRQEAVMVSMGMLD
jgi:Spy/CpxP family protein refolding chaperone